MRIQLPIFGKETAARLAEIAAGRLEPVPTRDAATVVVLRDTPGEGIAALMLRRPARMRFAPGAYVFPGGSVDPADYDTGALSTGDHETEAWWHGPSPAEFGARLGATAEVARALVWAAVRETFEESGILLAARGGDDPVVVPSGPSWEADRMALVSGQLSMTELLARRGLVLRADLLVPWARWITPVGEARRFDARFFAAALPGGQVASGHEAEADHIAWLLPASAVGAAKAGEMALLPPTATILNEVAVAAKAGRDLAGILGAARVVEPVKPDMVLEDGSVWLVIPDEVGCPL